MMSVQLGTEKESRAQDPLSSNLDPTTRDTTGTANIIRDPLVSQTWPGLYHAGGLISTMEFEQALQSVQVVFVDPMLLQLSLIDPHQLQQQSLIVYSTYRKVRIDTNRFSTKLRIPCFALFVVVAFVKISCLYTVCAL